MTNSEATPIIRKSARFNDENDLTSGLIIGIVEYRKS